MQSKIRFVMNVYVFPAALVFAAVSVWLFDFGVVSELVFRIGTIAVLLISTVNNVTNAVKGWGSSDPKPKIKGEKALIALMIICLALWLAGWIMAVVTGKI